MLHLCQCYIFVLLKARHAQKKRREREPCECVKGGLWWQKKKVGMTWNFLNWGKNDIILICINLSLSRDWTARLEKPEAVWLFIRLFELTPPPPLPGRNGSARRPAFRECVRVCQRLKA